MGIKNVFKWRVTTNKYLYLTDEENQAPFILDKRTGDRTYPQPISGSTVTGTTVITGMTLDEGLISQTVSKIKSADSYSEKYDKMLALVPFDNDASKLTFLEYDKYFNLDGDECVEEAVIPKCEGYEPVFNVSAYTLQNSGETEVEYTFYAERNEADKTLRYNLELGIPRGEKGEKGDDGIGCKGDKGDDGLPAIIENIEADITAIDPDEEASVEVVSSKTGDNEYELSFDFRIPRGEQGEEGPIGDEGPAGWDAKVTNVTATATALVPGSTPYAIIPTSSITINENALDKINETSFRIDFGLPTGLQGVQGNDGRNAEIREVTASVETLEPGYWYPSEDDPNRSWIRNDAEVGVDITPGGGGNVVDLHFWFKIPRGDKGDKGDMGGGSDTGGWMYNFFDPQFIPTPGLEIPIGDWDVHYHQALAEADVKLQIYYPEDWGGGGGSTYYEGNNISIDSGNTISARGYEWNETKRSFAEGENQTNEASGSYSHAEGFETEASGTNSHAEGDSTRALGNASHAEGDATTTFGIATHAEGYGTTAYGYSSHAEGNETIACGSDSHAEGQGDIRTITGVTFTLSPNSQIITASTVNDLAVFDVLSYNDEYRYVAFVSGLTVTLNNAFTVSETVSGVTLQRIKGISYGTSSHAEGNNTVASGDYSHAEGINTVASGYASHAEGINTVASGKGSLASGKTSHAEGRQTQALDDYAHAECFKTIASGLASHAEGTGQRVVALIAYRENTIGEKVYNYQTTKLYSSSEIMIDDYLLSDTGNAISIRQTVIDRIDMDNRVLFNLSSGSVNVFGDDAEHYVYIIRGTNTSSGLASHVEGTGTVSSNMGSHAEGINTVASGEGSHAEGINTVASGDYSHAEGDGTTASGDYSHAGGIETIADQSGMTAIGRYNSTDVGNINGANLFVVGNGTSSGQSNIFAVTTNGISTPLLNLSSGATLNGGGGRIDFGNINSYTNKSDYYIECGVGQDYTLKLYSHSSDISLSAGNNVNISSTDEVNITAGDGNVTIITNNGEVRITGNTYCSGVYYAASDARKKNIVSSISLETAYELVEKCQTIFYTWKNKENKKQEIGLLAQEVRNYFPELVSEGPDGYLSLDYSRLTVVLMAVIRDLTQKVKKIDALEEKIKLLEDKLK